MVKRLGERLIEAGLVTPAAVEQALEHQKITRHRLGDCLVELGLIQEAVMLRFLAAELQTRFVSAEKLSRARIPTEILDMLPVRMAEARNVLPLACDPERKLLSVVAAEPQDKALLDELALVTGMSEVYAYVGLRSAVAAAIKKHYYGDPTAFSALESKPSRGPRADTPPLTGTHEPPAPTGASRSSPSLQLRVDTEPRLRPPRESSPSSLSFPLREPLLGMARGAVADNDYVETLNILVGLLERDRKHHRGHSASLARQATVVGRQMGLPPRELAALAIAAYLHDLGKPPDRHFCLASNAVNPEWKADAKRYCRVPSRLFEAVHLPVQVNTFLAQLYEAHDGSGTPQGLREEDVSLGARILATVDSYLELTKNPANAYGKLLSKEEGIAHLRENAGKLYDPMVADIVAQVQSGEWLRHRIANDGRQILIVEPDEGTRTDLMDSVMRQDLVVHALASLDAAYDALMTQDCDVLVLGLRLGLQEVLSLLQTVRASAESAGLPVVVVGAPDPGTCERLMMGGATAVVDPAEPDEAAHTLRSLYEERILHNGPARVVQGSLDEMPIPELLRTLGAGRKSGRLYLKHHAQEGFLHLERGRVVFASSPGLTGEQALQALLGLGQADFRYEPDSLLLEMPQLNKELDVLVQQLGARKEKEPPASQSGTA